MNDHVRKIAHLAVWHGTRDRRTTSSSLNDKVAIELAPMAAGETAVPNDRAPIPLTVGSVAVTYSGDQPPLVPTRKRNTSPTRLSLALLELTDSFGCSLMYNI
jgi:hypothetical protein